MTRGELLVALAAVVLLAALLVPVLAKARHAARRSACLANVRGLAAALRKYVDDAHGLVAHGEEQPSLRRNYWTFPLAGYGVDARTTLQCPEAQQPNPEMFAAGTALRPWNQPDLARSLPGSGAYSINGWLYDAKFSSTVYLGEEAAFRDVEVRTDHLRPLPTVIDPGSFHRLPLVRSPEIVPAFADAIWSETFPAPSDPIPADSAIGSGRTICFHLGQFCIARHGPAINVAFFDGHAETVPVEQLPTLPWQAHWPTAAPSGPRP